MVAAVLFDFNGVLVDDEHLHRAAFNQVLAPLQVTMSEQAYVDRYLGFDDRGAFRAVLLDHRREPHDDLIARLIQDKSVAYARMATTDLTVFRGAAEVVRTMASRVPVGVVSGALRSEIDSALAQMGIAECVSFVIAAEDVSACKPDPEGYRTATVLLRRRHGLDATATIVAVEDSVAGIESAREAEIAVAAVAQTYDRATLEGAGAYPVFEAIRDVTFEQLGRAASRPRGTTAVP